MGMETPSALLNGARGTGLSALWCAVNAKENEAEGRTDYVRRAIGKTALRRDLVRKYGDG